MLADDPDFDQPLPEPELTPQAWARISLSVAVAMVLVAIGLKGWSSWAWLVGAGLFAGLTIIGKGYWRPETIGLLAGTIGATATLGAVALLFAFNVLLSAVFLSGGIILGLLWRITS